MQKVKHLHIVITILIVLLGCEIVDAQTFENVRVRQKGLQIIVNYDLFGELQENEAVYVGYSIDNGNSYRRIYDAFGDVGDRISPGVDKEISWMILGKPISGKDVIFKVGTLKEFTPDGFVYVPAGKFHLRNIGAFYMSKYEITQKLFSETTGVNPSANTGLSNPVENVSWIEAIKFCNQLSRKNGLTPAYTISEKEVICDWDASGYRLPKEIEWEYAARSGGRTDRKWSGTNEAAKLSEYAWHSPNSQKKTHQVGTKLPNDLGLYDMSGNVWEWCWEQKNLQEDRLRGSSKNYHIVRGGGYFDYKYRPSDQDILSTSYRTSSYDGGSNNTGFRILGTNFHGIDLPRYNEISDPKSTPIIPSNESISPIVRSYLPYRNFLKKEKRVLGDRLFPSKNGGFMGSIGNILFPTLTFYGISISTGDSDLSTPPYSVDELDSTNFGSPARALAVDLDIVRFAIGSGGRGGWSKNLMRSKSGDMLPYRWEIPFFIRYSGGVPLYVLQNKFSETYNATISWRLYLGLGYNGYSSRLVSRDNSIIESQWKNTIYDQVELTIFVLEYLTGVSLGNINTLMASGEHYNEFYLRLQLALFN